MDRSRETEGRSFVTPLSEVRGERPSPREIEGPKPSNVALRLADTIEAVLLSGTPLRIDLRPEDVHQLALADSWELHLQPDNSLTFMSLPIRQIETDRALIVSRDGQNTKVSLDEVFRTR